MQSAKFYTFQWSIGHRIVQNTALLQYKLIGNIVLNQNTEKWRILRVVLIRINRN